MGKSKSRDTSAMDAAREQGVVDERLATGKTYADRPNQYNPFGSVEWGQSSTIDPSTGKPVTTWEQTQSYSPETQALIDQQMGNMGQRGMMQNNALDQAQTAMQDAPDWAQFGEQQGLEYNPDQIRQRAEDAAYQRDTMRLDPQFAQKRAAMETKMRGQGLRAGDQAWDSQIETFNQGSNDAYERARLGSVNQGRQEAGDLWNRQKQGADHANALRDKSIGEYTAKRRYSLDESNAIGKSEKDVLDFVGGAG